MTVRVVNADVLAGLALLPDESVHMCVTSPPYFGLRDYQIEPQVWGGDPGCAHEWSEEEFPDNRGIQVGKAVTSDARGAGRGQWCIKCQCWRGSLGLEPTIDLYVEHMVAVFREVRRVLRSDGVMFLNIGDSYAGSWGAQGRRVTESDEPSWHSGQIKNHPKRASGTGSIRTAGLKPKDLIGVPWMLAFALRADGWWLRSEIIWAKRAPMPESCTDRPTSATEKVFLLAKSSRYFYDNEAVKEEADGDTHSRGNKRAPPIENAGIGHKDWCAYMTRDDEIKSIGKRNQRNFWLLGPEPFPEAHFATFVSEIPRRAILAGTSEYGVCPKCAAPWERAIERETRASTGRGVHAEAGGRPHRNPGGGVGTDRRKAYRSGWRPTCSCDAGEPVPATVLDPFAGAFTTCLVAEQLRRHSIGIDLNPEYCEMGRRRLATDAPLFFAEAAQ